MKGLCKRLISFMLAVCMMVSMVPLGFAAEEQDVTSPDNNQNNDPTPVEEWTYVPNRSNPILMAPGDESSSDIVEVQVTATERATGNTVNVPGATVNLYVGSSLISSTTDDDNDGFVEVSLAGLSIEQRQNATISANKVVSRGKAIDGTGRDNLFQHFPTDTDGDYYRYTLELHSETIDTAGNWLGAKIPTGKESNKVDIVFIIDATGSMSGEINNVKNNIASFSENLIASGLDIRFCIIDYRDITLVSEDINEDTHVHTVSGSHWLTDIDSVVNTLASISASGGGDGPESVLDPLGYVANNALMNWRSDAYNFAFVLTDADYKTNNNHGYSSMSEVTAKLAEMGVVTSVITSSSYKSLYSSLYETTGGIYANINSSTFDQEMLALSDSIIESVTREMTLTLKEPRLLVNMSVCYLANNSKSKSADYKDAVKNVMNEYAHRLAETTDGHVMLDKVILFSTANRTNFYNTSQLASMADIRIETSVNDDGKGLSNVTIRSNAHPTGFFSDATYSGSSSNFNNLKDGSGIDGGRSFYRIQLSGTTYGWEVSFTNKDEVYEYSTTIMHEAGHYLLGFFDEYLDANGDTWNNGDGTLDRGESQWTQPYFGETGDTVFGGYGLMDNHHYGDIEISKSSIDYAYMTGGFSSAAISQHTNQSYLNGGSCEDSLVTLLTDSTFSSYHYASNIRNSGYQLGDYSVTYTKAASDRNAKYAYAGLNAGDFLGISPSGSGGGGGSSWSLRSATDDTAEATSAQDSVADVTFTSNEETVTITVSGDAAVGIMEAGDETFTDVVLTDGTAELPIAKSDLAEVRVTVTDGETSRYNTYYIDRSEDTDLGYLYVSADNAVMAYVTTDEQSSYTFIADNTGYTNGEYSSVNQATRISSDNGVGFDSGEIYSVANYLAEIDYTTLSWFKFANGEWTALATDCSEEENMNIGARADLAGEGLYVLMARRAPVGDVLPAENLAYTQSDDRDAVVTLTFDDPNPDSRYYNVYYSESVFTDKDADGVVVRSFPADSTSLTLNLLERGRTVYAAVEIVAKDGRRSNLSDIILVGGEADSDGDGIPDWYCDKYHLWGEPGEEKDIANSDDDRDGLTNLEEYRGGSDPTNPNDPVHTTNIPVTSVTASETVLTLIAGDTATVTATVMPENASNKNVKWSSANAEIAAVSAEGSVCTVTAISEGRTQVYAVTSDGGYSAVINVIVFPPESGEGTLSRIAGADRIETCLGIANQLKETLGGGQFSTVIVASALNFPDALTGSYLAAVKSAPILLTYEAANAQIREYIDANLADGGTVYILGGSAAVSTEFEQSIKALGRFSVKRLAGDDRFGTNLEIMKEAGAYENKEHPVLIATAMNFADSLSASAVGLPMVLVYGSLRADQKEFLAKTSGEFIIVGGEAAVSAKLEAELKTIGSVKRLAGTSRYQTSVLVAQEFFGDAPGCAVLAYARNFPDGLCAGPLANTLHAPLILTDNYDPSAADGYVKGTSTGFVIGGSSLISDIATRAIFDLSVDTPIH